MKKTLLMTEFSKSNESTKYLWLKWLESRNIFTSDGNKGGRYRIVTEYKGDDLDEEEKIFMEKAESSKKLLSEVLSGDKSTLSILDDDFLSPECLIKINRFSLLLKSLFK